MTLVSLAFPQAAKSIPENLRLAICRKDWNQARQIAEGLRVRAKTERERTFYLNLIRSNIDRWARNNPFTRSDQAEYRCEFASLQDAKMAELNNQLLRVADNRSDEVALQETAKLLNQGANINATIPGDTFVSGKNSLHIALIGRNYRTAKFLIDRGINIHHKDAVGLTPLHFVGGPLADGAADMLRYLLAKKPKLEEPNNYGLTPLHYAVAKYESLRRQNERHKEVYRDFSPEISKQMALTRELIQILVQAGANVNVSNKEGRTLLSDAQKSPEILSILQSRR